MGSRRVCRGTNKRGEPGSPWSRGGPETLQGLRNLRSVPSTCVRGGRQTKVGGGLCKNPSELKIRRGGVLPGEGTRGSRRRGRGEASHGEQKGSVWMIVLLDATERATEKVFKSLCSTNLQPHSLASLPERPTDTPEHLTHRLAMKRFPVPYHWSHV